MQKVMNKLNALRFDAMERNLKDYRVVDLEERLDPREVFVERDTAFGTDDADSRLGYPGESFGKEIRSSIEILDTVSEFVANASRYLQVFFNSEMPASNRRVKLEPPVLELFCLLNFPSKSNSESSGRRAVVRGMDRPLEFVVSRVPSALLRFLV